MTELESKLIAEYKYDFKQLTGKSIKIAVLDAIEDLCTIEQRVPCKAFIQVICDAVDWDLKRLIVRSNTREMVSRRWIIDMILYANNYKLTDIGKATRRDHTTVIHSLKMGKANIPDDPSYMRLLKEIMTYVRENIQYYIPASPVEA